MVTRLNDVRTGDDFTSAALVLNLIKGRTKGSQNVVHRYLVRLVLPGTTAEGNPRYKYVKPDPEEVASFHPITGYKLKPGVTASQIVNRELFGDYGIGQVKDRATGAMIDKPWKVPGFFFDYEAERVPGPDKKWRFKTIRKQPGYVSIQYGPQVERMYTPPAKLTDLQLSPEAAAEAAALAPGAGVASGADDVAPQVRLSDVVPIGERNIHALPDKPTMDNQLHEDAPEYKYEKIDPMQLASGFTATPVLIDKYDSKEKLLEELQHRPITTLITAGQYSFRNKKMQAALQQEWGGVVVKLSQRAAHAFRVTDTYQHFQEADARDGNTAHTRKFTSDVLRDLIQKGYEKLLRLARSYKPSDRADDRFDKLAGVALKRTLSDAAAAAASEMGLQLPIIEEEDEEEAAHKMGAQIEISPEEHYELEQYTGPAKSTLFRVINGAEFPEAYRRILLARLWLDDDESEKQEIKDRKIKRRQNPSQTSGVYWQRRLTGANSIAAKYPTWVDPDTGKPVDMGKLHQNMQLRYLNRWHDAAITSVLHALTMPVARVQSAHPDAIETMGPVYKVPSGKDMPRDQYGTPVKLTTGQAAQLLTDMLLGRGNTKDKRVLTHEGKLVKRWLELEAKLAGSNRRRTAQRDEHLKMRGALPIMGGAGKPRDTKHVIVPASSTTTHSRWPRLIPTNPSVAFWTSTPNQRLAAKLGIRMEGLGNVSVETARKLGITRPGDSGLFGTPNVSVGTASQAMLDHAEKHHKTLLTLRTMTPAALDKKAAEAVSTAKKIRSLGHYRAKADGTGVEWHSPGKHGLQALHETVEAYQHIDSIVKDKLAGAKQARKEFGSSTLSDGAKAAKLAEYVLTAAEKDQHAAATARMEDMGNKVGALYPAVVHTYAEALRLRTPVTQELLAEHKAALHTMLRDTVGEKELVDFEKQRRAAEAAVAKSLYYPIPQIALLRTIETLDYELGMLHAVL